MANALQMDDQRAGPVHVLAVSGRVDSSNAADLSERLSALLSAGARAILVDLARVLYLTSAGFRALIVATETADGQQATLALCAISDDVRELFEVGGLLDFFRVYGTREEALSALS